MRAQEVRRIVDRLYGYDVSPLLWRKIRPRLSAGRVQSVAVRLIVERERQRMAFRSATYWDLVATFAKSSGETFEAQLVSVDERKIPAGRDFDPATGQLKDAGCLLLDEQQAASLGGEASAGGRPRRRVGRQALYDEALSALHHQHDAAGGQSQVRLHRAADDGCGAEPLRERAHHLHAHRLDEPGQRGHRHGAADHLQPIRQGLSARCPADLPDQSEKCPGSPRGDPPGRASLRAAGGLAEPVKPGRVSPL